MNLDIAVLIEIGITLAIIFIQYYFYSKTRQSINILKVIFPDNDLDSKNITSIDNGNEIAEIIKIDNLNCSPRFSAIIKSINEYLIKNKGAIDFGIIKSVVERNIEAEEEDISGNISLPLYIGLMGTFLGILVGLLRIAFFGGVIQENINSFIGGVFIAMIASLIGLFLTVINNSNNFKNAKKINDRRKNAFFDFLQIQLLPHLGNSIYDVFNRFKDNISNFNEKFSGNLDKFDEKFSENIDILKESVETISENITPIIDNIQTQKDFLKELRGKGYEKAIAANLRTFEIMESAVPNFLLFIEKQKELNTSIEKTADFVFLIDSVMTRVAKFEQSINALGDRIDNADYMGSDLLQKINKKLEILDNQFELLKQHSQHSKGTLEYHFEQEVSKIKMLSDKILIELQEALNFNIDSNPLVKLRLLENIDSKLREIGAKPTLDGELRNIARDVSLFKDNIRLIKENVDTGLEEMRNKNKKKKPAQNDDNQGKAGKSLSFWGKLNPFRNKRKKRG